MPMGGLGTGNAAVNTYGRRAVIREQERRRLQALQPGGLAGDSTVKAGGIVSSAMTGITPRSNPAERAPTDDTVGPKRTRPLGPRRRYGRGLGGQVRNVIRP